MKWFATEATQIEIQGRPVRVCRPDTPTKKAIVFYHGWSSRASLNLFRGMSLAARGYLVLVPEAVHHGERGTLDYDDPVVVARHMFPVIDQNADEFSDLVDWLHGEGIQKILVTGHSMGGFTAANIFTRYPEVDACVSLNGSFAFQNAADGMLQSVDPALAESVEKAFQSFRQDPQDQLDRLADRPLLLINGGDDGVIDPMWQGEFYEKLRKKYKNEDRIRRIIIPYLGHFVTTNMIEEILAFAEEFMEDEA